MASGGCEMFRKYDFPTEPIPRLPFDSKAADERISKGLPVVLEGGNLAAPALRWTNDYLCEHLGNGTCSVYASKTHEFRYYDEKKVPHHKHFRSPMTRREMTFTEFTSLMRNHKPGDDRLYLQQSLNDQVGRQVVMDFLQFNWAWVNDKSKKNSWGPLTSNLLLVSMEGNVTPCHYDEQENFFNQLQGLKRVILFPPEQFECLYPYPIHHPHDRQTQIDFDCPNYELFPRFREVRGMEAVLKPGDVLYLPMYWFHHFESQLHGGPTTSLTFWYKAAPTAEVVYPLKAHQKMAMMRNIEKMITDALNDWTEVGPFFQNMVLGRYTHDCDRPPAQTTPKKES